MMHRVVPAVTLLAACAGAWAQPVVTADLGPLAPGTTSVDLGVGFGNMVWVRFEIPEVSRCQTSYLDIVTEPFITFDSEIGLYDSLGKRITNDDDDGPDRGSMLTFGAITPERSYPAGALPGNGREGPLAAGTYYVAVAAFNATFLDEDWGAIPDGEGQQGGAALVFHLGAGDAVSDAPDLLWESLCAGDAGRFPDSAAVGQGSGPMTVIRGFGQSRDDIDLYKVCITDAASFMADTAGSLQMDTQLFLFDANGRGVTLNDDFDSTVQSRLTASVVGGLGNGEYYLAIAPQGCVPQDSSGQNLWGDGSGERMADGPGGANPLGQWNNFVVNDNTWYVITLQGASFCAGTPACGTADFDGDGDTGTDADIEAFFACLAGTCCGTCFALGADFNADGDVGTDADIESFFRVLAGGPC
jgi:hypothetical protein